MCISLPDKSWNNILQLQHLFNKIFNKIKLEYLIIGIYICCMNLTEKQKEISERIKFCKEAHLNEKGSKSVLVEKLSKKFKVSVVQIYNYIKG